MNHLGVFRSKNQLFKNISNLLQSTKSNLYNHLYENSFKPLHKPILYQVKRTFLTENYYCYDQWDKFLLSDIVKKVGSGNS